MVMDVCGVDQGEWSPHRMLQLHTSGCHCCTAALQHCGTAALQHWAMRLPKCPTSEPGGLPICTSCLNPWPGHSAQRPWASPSTLVFLFKAQMGLPVDSGHVNPYQS